LDRITFQIVKIARKKLVCLTICALNVLVHSKRLIKTIY